MSSAYNLTLFGLRIFKMKPTNKYLEGWKSLDREFLRVGILSELSNEM